MNGMILQTPTESKDIKHISKKASNTEEVEDGNLFENLILKLVEKDSKEGESDFLLAKLLDLQSNFEKKGKILSEFSKGDILDQTLQGDQVPLEALFKMALMLKNGAPQEEINKLAKSLDIPLDDKKIVSEFKSATNIKELLSLAEKHNIKVKNFTFFMPQAALNAKDKKIIQKITSEDIFKMIEPKSIQKEGNPLQSTLTKMITKDLIQQEQTQSVTKQAPSILTAVLDKSNKKPSKAQQAHIGTINQTSKKESKVPQQVEKLDRAKTDTIKDSSAPELEVTETFKAPKIEKSHTNTLASLLHAQASSKDNKVKQTILPSVEELEKTKETSTESKEPSKVEISTEKTTPTHEIKTDSVQKHKETADIKKTFNTFAMEFKEKVEAYKPPMMKINMQLNPGTLGDVDVTLVNRGNNLQVNINSNTNTMALFIQNQAEFKNSLVNMGFSDLQMNFAEKKEQGQQQQQNKQKEQESDYLDSLEEENEGINMILPNYV